MDPRSGHTQPHVTADHDGVTAAIILVAPAYRRTGTPFDLDLRASVAIRLADRGEAAPQMVLSAMSEAYSRHAAHFTPALALALESLGENDPIGDLPEYVLGGAGVVGEHSVDATELASAGDFAPHA